jgi:signal transduction histidine kinase
VKKKSPNFLVPFQDQSPALRQVLALFPALLLFTTYTHLPVYLNQIPLTLCYIVIILACWINGVTAGALAGLLSVLTVYYQVPVGFFADVINKSQGITRISVFFGIGMITITLLLKTREALIKAHEAITLRNNFLDLASHELRTPLTALRLNLSIAQQLAQDKDPVAGANFLLKSSDRQVLRLERLIEAMMDITMFDSGHLQLIKKPCNLKPILMELIAQMNHPSLKIECSEQDLHGNWDQTRLEQIISNVVGNAVKYGEGKDIQIKMGQEGKYIWFSVKDHGPGIAKEEQQKIFERFHRSNMSINVQGLGLGLYLTKQLVEIHGGEIILQSTPGAGSLFTVKLPA